MEVTKRQLPNASAVLILGILSILGCCFYGIPGLILGIIAVVLGTKDKRLYNSNPDKFSGIGNVNAGYLMGWISIIISLIFTIFIFVFGGLAILASLAN
jgi:hypothetical protein